MALIRESLMVTGFVVAMMLLVECAQLGSSGRLAGMIRGGGVRQYVIAGLVGVVPGCLGAFSVVALYTHGLAGFGALVTAMIAASGDEAFVMLALIPSRAPLVFVALLTAGILVGIAVDRVPWIARLSGGVVCPESVVHVGVDAPFPLSSRRVFRDWRRCTVARGALSVSLSLFLLGICAGEFGPAEWNWVRATMCAVTGGALLVVATAPEHFLEKHLWEHVVRGHATRVFGWTLVALFVSSRAAAWLRMEEDGGESQWALLLGACLIGLIPESGPHLVFVTLYAQGAIPFGVLLGSSIVQDGHGALPLLAHSRRAFLVLKAVNLAAGLLFGAAALLAGAAGSG